MRSPLLIVKPAEPGFCATVLAVVVSDTYLRSPQVATVEDIAEVLAQSPHLMTELQSEFERKIRERY